MRARPEPRGRWARHIERDPDRQACGIADRRRWAELTGNGIARSGGWDTPAFAESGEFEGNYVVLPGNQLGFTRALIISDPDEHHVELTQP
jgi:hypothetical protein